MAWQAVPQIDVLRERYPKVQAVTLGLTDNRRITTGGVVLHCADVTLHLLSRMLGADVATEKSSILEYLMDGMA